MGGVLLGLLASSTQAASSPLGIIISPDPSYDFRVGAGNLTSSAVTGSASGGAGGYTYAWTYISGSSYTINAPSSAATTFTTTLSASQLKSGVYRCTVTDSLSATASADVTVELESV